MLNISVRDYRGIERADIALDPLALVAGKNEHGKSSLAEATRAVLTGTAIPIPGVNKKDAKVLVRDGAEKGSAKATNEHGFLSIEWPRCITNGEEGNPGCTDFAVGLRHLFDLDDKEQAKVLARYVDSEPTADDLAAAMKDAGYGERALDKVWDAIDREGWDKTHQRTRDHGTRLKGQWEAVTGEKYGAKKAKSWAPAGYPEGAVHTSPREDPLRQQNSRPGLQEAVDQANTELERLLGQRAVAEADVQKLREKAEAIPTLEEQEREAAEERQNCATHLEDLQKDPAPEVPTAPTLCPSCNTALTMDRNSMTLVVAESAPTEEEISEAERAKYEYEGLLTEARDAFNAASNAHGVIVSRLMDARQAAAKLEEIEAQGEGASEADVEAAREHLHNAQHALWDFDAKERADQIHADIVKNAALIDILAPDGLRRRKLAAGLEKFNNAIGNLCHAAGWPEVSLDESLSPHYGSRPVWAASASGKWRARTCVQVAMAQMDGSAAVVIDEADILDATGRNGLVAMLEAFRVRALVCMTANRPERVPDLEQAGIGQSYWVRDGVVQRIHGGESEAQGAA